MLGCKMDSAGFVDYSAFSASSRMVLSAAAAAAAATTTTAATTATATATTTATTVVAADKYRDPVLHASGGCASSAELW